MGVMLALFFVVGNTAPDFSLADARGKAVTLSGYKGKVVVLDFWAAYRWMRMDGNP